MGSHLDKGDKLRPQQLAAGCVNGACFQASIRLILLLIAAITLAASAQATAPSESALITSGLVIGSLLILVVTAFTSRATKQLREVSAAFDPLAITILLLLGGSSASPLWLAYPLAMFDHGRRFGHRALYTASGFSFSGFALVLAGSGYWQQNTGLGLALLTGLALFAFLVARSQPPQSMATESKQEALATHPVKMPVAVEPTSPKRVNEHITTGNHRFKPGELEGKRILLLSNDRNDQHGIQRHLDSWGAETRVCGSSVRAFAALIGGEQRHTPYHSVIVEQGQFDMDSRQFAISLRSDPALQALNLVHIGMPALSSLVDQFYSIGYNQLLRKPLDKTLLFSALLGTAQKPLGDRSQVVQLLDHYSDRSQCQPLSVLLAETDPNEQQRIRMNLQQAGHRVFLVDDGTEVLNAIDSQHFDLAILSYQLREISGLEAFKLYRFTRLDEEWIPFIMLLNSQSVSKAQACEDAGVDATLTRPYSSRQLMEQVEQVSQRHLGQHAGDQGNNITSFYTSQQVIVIDGLTLDGQRLEELEQLGKGREFLAELLRNFDRECQQFTNRVEEAISQGSGRQLKDIGHTIKDGAGNLGMLDLYHIGVKFTRLPTQSLPDNIDTLLLELKQCCQASHKALQHYLSKRDTFLGS